MDSGGATAYPDSVDSSPRSRGGESWDEQFPSPSSKLRVMCSYGGRIVPRPTDKSLCYLGGETRMVSVDRHSSLPDLAARLSRTLLGGRPFTLKYQLPNEDLDSLISVTADEDLDNLIDEYDRLTASGTKSQRIRLFLFPCKSESAPSSITTINSLLDDSKSETWFVDALNGALIEGVLPRRLSADAASVNTLLGLEDDSSVHSRGGGAAAPENGDLRLPQPESSGKIPDSPMRDTTSSFGSASSVPYLPPIRVRPDDRAQIAGVEDQFVNMNVSGGVVATAGQEMLKEMGFAPQNPAPVSAAVTNPIVSPTGREFPSDDDKSDQGGAKKMLPVTVSSQSQQQKAAPVDAPIGDPVTRPMYYQDSSAVNVAAAAAVVATPAVAAPAVTTAVTATDPSYRGYLLPEQVQFQQQYHQQQHQQQQQQQYTHYINPATGTVHPVPSMPSYYQMPHAIQQPHPYDQQIPMYYMPMRPSQPYNMAPMQSNLVDATAVAAAASTATMRPNQPYNLAPPQPNLVDATIVAAAASTATTIPANQAAAAHLKAPANSANLYRVAAPTVPGLAASGQQLIHMTPDQAQAYAGMGYQIMHHPHPQYPPQSATPMANYGYATADQSHQPQVYYTQATSTQSMAAQYQALSSAGATVTDTGLAPQPQLQNR